MARPVAVCADVGSTFTKVALVALDSGELVAAAEHPTTVDTDVLHGLDAAVATATAAVVGSVEVATTEVCSSAGGGLRLAVVGYEQLVTAQAGHRAGLSAGAKVVHVAAGRLDPGRVAALRQARPDIVLLVGGTDGGDADTLLHNAGRLASARLRIPVVVAGNAEVQAEVAALFATRGTATVVTDNVLPRIGVLSPGPARSAIRELFLRHVIGGKRLSRGPRFASLVRGATPDLVLRAVELLADHGGGADLLVVDVGGATTDVYSAVSPDPDAEAPLAAPVAGMMWRGRTVEGDLGLRWSAPGVVSAAAGQALLGAGEDEQLAAAAAARASEPSVIPRDATEASIDARLAGLAATIAVRRHARGELGSERDLRRVGLLIGSGGVLRHAPADLARSCLSAVLTDHAGGWALPRDARIVVDSSYVLAPAGLLADAYPEVALALLTRHLVVGP